MSCTVVFYHDATGESLTLTLRNNAGAIVNSGGTSLTESAGLRYTASVSQALAGWYVAQIYDANDDVIYTGSVKVANDSGIYRIDDPAAEIPAAGPTANAIASAIWSADQRTLTKFGFNVTAEVNPEQLSDAIGAAMGDGVSVEVASFTPAALAQIAVTRTIHADMPTLGQQLLPQPFIQGDTYSLALNSAIEFSRSDFPDLPEGMNAKLSAVKRESGQETRFEISGDQASVPARTGTKIVRFEPTAEQTRLWEPGKYEFDVQLTWPNGSTRTFVGPNVFLRVLADVSASS